MSSQNGFFPDTARAPASSEGGGTVTDGNDADSQVSRSPRQTVNLRPRDLRRLERVMEYTGGNANEAFRMALGLAELVVDVLEEGGKLHVETESGRREVVPLL